MATQLITPNPNIACTPGECLVYVQDTFGLKPKYPSASAAWNASNYKHADQDFPVDTWVPLWFSLQDNPDGHVVLRQPDGSVWSSSSPTSTTPVHHPSLDDLEKYYGGRLKYLGWTEDIEDTLVIANSDAARLHSAIGAEATHGRSKVHESGGPIPGDNAPTAERGLNDSHDRLVNAELAVRPHDIPRSRS